MADPVYTRLDTVAALAGLFVRASTGAGGGAWLRDSGGSTVSGNTGPSSNAPDAYMYSETSNSTSFATILEDSVITALTTTDEWVAWVNAGRTLDFRACMQSNAANGTDTSGLELQGSEDGGTTWERISLLNFWSWTGSRSVGDMVTDAGGNIREVVYAGGWVDYSIEVETKYDGIRFRVIGSTGNTYQHDVALWQISFTPGDAPVTPPTTPAADGRLLWRQSPLLWRGSELHWRDT